MIEPLQGAFRALGDPTRRQILVHLADGDLTIGELVDRFPMTRAAVKKHLTVLEEGRLITVRPRGRERVNRLEPEGLRVTAQWISTFSRFWDDRLGDLQAAIEQEGQSTND